MKSETVEAWSVHGPISMVLWRGIIEMSIGVLLFHIQHFHPFIGKHSGLIFNCLTILSLVSILAIITMRPFRDKYIYIAVAILIYGCMREDSWLEKICHHALISNLGSLSLDMYLIHISVASVASWALKHVSFSPVLGLFGYLILVIISAKIFQNIADFLIVHKKQ